MEIVPRSEPLFSETVNTWFALDNEQQLLLEKLAILRKQKQKLSDSIMHTLESKNKLHCTLDLPEGQLRVLSRKEYGHLTFQYIEKCFESLILDDSQRDFVLKFLKDNREVKNVSELKRYNKNRK
jgi:hypothetical protein